ncbi:hypothetical protein BST85_05500 [Aureitalea marina]|uniref:DUF1800 domain-containing protein n=2 Tax=Aureitalea marina TaxID=930804 RepID=A0A2S7KTK4_9FLAO|nr:hypothetical protein BST85_05500 [Aureitalea marina]
MDRSSLWSLRLGYSRKQAEQINSMGLSGFLNRSFVSNSGLERPSFLDNEPNSLSSLQSLRKEMRKLSTEDKKARFRETGRRSQQLRAWWVDRMRSSEFPLQDKMCCFLHNHFVSTFSKIRVNEWIFRHHQLLYNQAFGNFRELTKQVIRTNAMVQYLDNIDNKKDQLNENLSRELLELFTLGIGNYTEEDIREGAKALAGLGLGEFHAVYKERHKYDGFVHFLGSTGKYDSDDLVDIIFEQDPAPFLFVRKLMQWFLYDEPKEEWVSYYGNYFREVDFEIKPLLNKLFLEEYDRDLRARKIKDPLHFMMHLTEELSASETPALSIVDFIRTQGMDLFNQPNVKGWPGGQSWLSTQYYLQRNKIANMLCKGVILDRSELIMGNAKMGNSMQRQIEISNGWNGTDNAKETIENFSNRLISESNAQIEADINQILRYDFDPSLPKASKAVMRLFNFMVNSPEFQLI